MATSFKEQLKKELTKTLAVEIKAVKILHPEPEPWRLLKELKAGDWAELLKVQKKGGNAHKKAKTVVRKAAETGNSSHKSWWDSLTPTVQGLIIVVAILILLVILVIVLTSGYVIIAGWIGALNTATVIPAAMLLV